MNDDDGTRHMFHEEDLPSTTMDPQDLNEVADATRPQPAIPVVSDDSDVELDYENMRESSPDDYDDYDYDESDDDYVDGKSDDDYVEGEESDFVPKSSVLKKRKISEQECPLAKKEAVEVPNMDNFVTMSTSIQSEQLVSEEMNKGEKIGKQAMKMEDEDLQLEDGPRIRKRVTGMCPWVHPFEGWLRVDTDGSVKRGKKGGYGAIIRDHEGDVVVAAAGSSDVTSPLYNQVLGVKLGLELAKKHKLDKIQVTTNYRLIYRLITFYREVLEEEGNVILKPVLDEIKSLMEKDFENVQVRYIVRGINKAADYLSKLFKNCEIKPAEFDEKLQKIVDDDAAGVLYECLF